MKFSQNYSFASIRVVRAATEEYMSIHFFICKDEFNEICLMVRGAEQVNNPRSVT